MLTSSICPFLQIIKYALTPAVFLDHQISGNAQPAGSIAHCYWLYRQGKESSAALDSVIHCAYSVWSTDSAFIVRICTTKFFGIGIGFFRIAGEVLLMITGIGTVGTAQAQREQIRDGKIISTVYAKSSYQILS